MGGIRRRNNVYGLQSILLYLSPLKRVVLAKLHFHPAARGSLLIEEDYRIAQQPEQLIWIRDHRSGSQALLYQRRTYNTSWRASNIVRLIGEAGIYRSRGRNES